VSIYKRPESSRYVVEIRWRGVPRMKLSTGTGSKTRAGAMERTLQALRDAGRFDVLRLLAEGKTSKDIAIMLDLGLQTVRTYRKTLMKKLGVNNIASLTQVALTAGLARWASPTREQGPKK